MKKLLVILLLLSAPVWAGNIPTTFYVDQTGGNDNNTGLATDNAWKTVSKVNAFSRTNLITYSDVLTNAAWVKRGTGAVGVSTTGPDGIDNSAYSVSGLGADGANDIYHAITVSNATAYVPSFYIKRISTTGVIACKSGVITGLDGNKVLIDLSLLGDGWERIVKGHPAVTTSFNLVNTSGTTIYHQFFADSGGPLSIYLFGNQFELGTTPTPYVPSPTTAVTASFQPGDNVLFKRGESWASEQIVVPSSGTEGNVITFGRYGSGADPVFSASPDLNGQTYVTLDLTTPPGSSLRGSWK
jgi:hypothetical protein